MSVALKMKPKATEDLKIVGIEWGEPGKQWEGKVGSIVVERKTRDGNTVKVGVASGLTHYDHENIIVKDDDILYRQTDGEFVSIKGKLVEVTYDCITEDGSLRFPRIKKRGDSIIRTDK